MLTPIEELDLEINNELVLSYIYLLQYINDHRAETLSNIEKPEFVKDEKYLCLTSNSIRQLNVLNNHSYFKGKNESLLSVCNLCVTPMGRRLFKERLLYPSIDRDIIQKRYDCINLFKKDKFYELICKDLRKVSDLEKSLRKMGLGILQPNDFFSDSLSFDYAIKVVQSLKGNDEVLTFMDDNIDFFEQFHNEINETFLFQNFSPSGNLEKSILKPGIHLQLDDYDKLTDDYINILLNIVKRLSHLYL